MALLCRTNWYPARNLIKASLSSYAAIRLRRNFSASTASTTSLFSLDLSPMAVLLPTWRSCAERGEAKASSRTLITVSVVRILLVILSVKHPGGWPGAYSFHEFEVVFCDRN